MAEVEKTIAVRDEAGTPMQVSDVVQQVKLIQELMRGVMVEGEHYGTIPGCGDKKALLKPGAEKLNLTFRLDPQVEIEEREMENGHRNYIATIIMYAINSGRRLGSGVGSCSTMESKYRWRTGPTEDTGQPVRKEYWDIRKTDPIKAQEMLGGKGFVTKKNEGGIWTIQLQGEKLENPDIADVYNTCRKMAKKRALIDAVLTVTAASDIFVQDVDEGHIADAVGVDKPTTKPAVAMPKAMSDVIPQEVASELAEQQFQAEKKSEYPISEAQVRRLYAIARSSGFTEANVKQRIRALYGIESATEIDRGNYDEICKWYENNQK